MSIPPIKIKNNTYENQNLFDRMPVNTQIKIVCINKSSPILKGWLICENIILLVIIKVIIIICMISGNSLINKILILEIKDKYNFFLKTIKINFNFGLQDQCFY